VSNLIQNRRFKEVGRGREGDGRVKKGEREGKGKGRLGGRGKV